MSQYWKSVTIAMLWVISAFSAVWGFLAFFGLFGMLLDPPGGEVISLETGAFCTGLFLISAFITVASAVKALELAE